MGVESIGPDNQILEKIKGLYKVSSEDVNIDITRGYNMAFGVISKKMIQALQPELVEVVLRNCVPKGKENDDAE